MINGVLTRLNSDDSQTIGHLNIYNEKKVVVNFSTLELAHKRNERSVSRIPSGRYECVMRSSEKYGNHVHLLGVPNRTFILIHSGNFHQHTKGCILIGDGLVDINNDGKLDVTNSKNSMRTLIRFLEKEDSFYLTVLDLDY